MSSIFQRVSSRWIKDNKDDDGSEPLHDDYTDKDEEEAPGGKRKRAYTQASANKAAKRSANGPSSSPTSSGAGAGAGAVAGAATQAAAASGGSAASDIDPEIAKPDYRADGSVDAAVYQLVRASLGQDAAEKRARTSSGSGQGQARNHDETDIGDWSGQPWEKYLNTENLAENGSSQTQNDYAFFSSLASGVTAAATAAAAAASSAPPARNSKKSKKNQQSSNVDPALAHLDETTTQNYDLEEAVRQARSIRAEVDSAAVDGVPGDDYDNSLGSLKPELKTSANYRTSAGRAPSAKALNNDKRVSWTGDGSETGGTFSHQESMALQNFMEDYRKLQGWTKEELKQRVWASERQKDSFWDEVAAVLPHRTRASVYKHVRRAYHVFEARGKWTKEEDIILGELVRRKGAQWKAIGLDMERMPEDCRDRWRNYVKCGDKRKSNKWELEEEEQLKSVVLQMMQDDPSGDVNWTLVSENMGGTRSRIQCRYKWNKLSKKAKESGRAIDFLKLSDKVDLINFLRSSPVMREDDVNWDKLANMLANGRITPRGSDILTAFTNMKMTIADYKNKSFNQILNEILDNLYRGAATNLPNDAASSANGTNDEAVTEALKRDEGSEIGYA